MHRTVSMTPAAIAARSDDSIRIDMSNFAEDYRTATVYLDHDWENVSDDAGGGGMSSIANAIFFGSVFVMLGLIASKPSTITVRLIGGDAACQATP